MNAERKFLLPVLFLRCSFTLSTLSVYSSCSPIYLTYRHSFARADCSVIASIFCYSSLPPSSVTVKHTGDRWRDSFGPLLGTLLSLIAATLASSCSFLLARWLGRDLLLKYVGHSHTFRAIDKGIARNGIDFLILTRLIPLFPYNIQNYAYGLT